jgi:hypothetical protein
MTAKKSKKPRRWWVLGDSSGAIWESHTTLAQARFRQYYLNMMGPEAPYEIIRVEEFTPKKRNHAKKK